MHSLRNLATTLAAALALTAPALAEPWYKVGNVATNDTLNVRSGPSVAFPVLSKLAPSEGGLEKRVCVLVKPDPDGPAPAKMPEWCLIARSGTVLGWSHARYLVEDEPVAGGATPTVSLVFLAGYRSYNDTCQLVGDSAAMAPMQDAGADIVACPVSDAGIDALIHEVGARRLGVIDGYMLLAVPLG
ncbi:MULTISPECIES: hypothetical protein [unclassified Marinovum]